MNRCSLLAVLAIVSAVPASAQTPPPEPVREVIHIWPEGASGAEARKSEPERIVNSYVHNVQNPSLTVFPADPRHANHIGMIVIPGGGHQFLVWQNEGVGPAKALNRYGITAFVLKYRLAREPGSTYTIEGDAAADARRAVRWVRAHAARYHVDPHRIGMMGFSAGGELVTLVADNPAPPRRADSDAVDSVSGRPDFQVLVYPGPLGIPAKAAAGAPPAFITAGTLDPCCAMPAMTLYKQLRDAHVSAELHLWADIGHGFNIAAHSERLSIAHWPDRLADWLSDEGLLTPGDADAAAPVP
ncbi:alpha/beta hydrolase [Hephaestia mangrovi]|uniref:alpha/beta hydrolase n=1 Tax=Hephaestia mangrovi TaxID=2873268 RepID=UPI001CA7393C|nr:alpha/beta hydrolase [Hephaestia mangrovi]MBY8828050.1 alpha/beta hydrolase [Hephaestia mangrovi]